MEGRETLGASVEAAVATYHLRIYFSGLCAFVPRGEDDEDLRRMDVFLVDPTNTNGGRSDAHLPLLVFYLKNLVEVTSDLNDTQGFWNLEEEDVLFFLQRRDTQERIRFDEGVRLAEGRKPGPFAKRPLEDKSISDEEERDRDYLDQISDFSWLPKISQIVGEDGAQADSNDADCANPSSFVAARIHVEAGIFSTDDLFAYRGYPVAQFVPPLVEEEPYSQAFDQRIVVDIEVDARFDIVVEATSYNEGVSRELVLKPVDGMVQIEVSNLCGGEYFAPDYDAEWKLQPDHDFVHLYLLSKIHDELDEYYDGHWPVPVAVRYPISSLDRGTGGIAPIRCSGAVYNTLTLRSSEEGASTEDKGSGRRRLREQLAKNQERRHGARGK